MTYSCFLAFFCMQVSMHAYLSETNRYNICNGVCLLGINAWYALSRLSCQVSFESLHHQAVSHQALAF